ncbi:MAG: hypothetical protein Q9214_002836 [Letrouitia sp. 1 TL-2023]
MQYLISTAAFMLAAANVVMGNNINGWTGCSGDQKNIVTQAYKDALRLGDYVDPYRGHDEHFAPTSPNQTVDSSKLSDALSIRFFGQQTIAGSSQAVTPNWQKDIANFKTQGQIFLHEMTHLLVISDKNKIIDFKWPEGSARAYGPTRCEKLARQSDQKNTWDAILNADNYAMYTAGSCDTQSSNSDGSPVDDHIDEGSFTVNSAYVASMGYDADTSQVSDMISWASTALKNPHNPASTTITTLITSAPPAPSPVPAAPSNTSPAPPPTCTQK